MDTCMQFSSHRPFQVPLLDYSTLQTLMTHYFPGSISSSDKSSLNMLCPFQIISLLKRTLKVWKPLNEKYTVNCAQTCYLCFYYYVSSCILVVLGGFKKSPASKSIVLQKTHGNIRKDLLIYMVIIMASWPALCCLDPSSLYSFQLLKDMHILKFPFPPLAFLTFFVGFQFSMNEETLLFFVPFKLIPRIHCCICPLWVA